MDQVRSHWRLAADPFPSIGGAFVPLPSHREAIARVVHAIKAGEPRVQVRAEGGLGKSVILDRVLAAVRATDLRIARASAADPGRWLDDLARALGSRAGVASDEPGNWKRLADAARLCRIQGQRIVLALDDHPGRGGEFPRFAALDPHPRARITVLEFGRPLPDISGDDAWSLKVRVPALTRGETQLYLETRLATAARPEPTFTPLAITQIHALSRGNPRGIDRLAGLSLMAGALRRLEIVPPDVVEGVSRECLLPRSA